MIVKDKRTNTVIEFVEHAPRILTHNVGNIFYIPTNPKFICTKSALGKACGFRVLAVDITDTECPIISEIWESQLCRKDNDGKLVFTDSVNVKIAHSHDLCETISHLLGGKCVTIVDRKKIKVNKFDSALGKYSDTETENKCAFNWQISENGSKITDKDFENLLNEWLKNITESIEEE